MSKGLFYISICYTAFAALAICFGFNARFQKLEAELSRTRQELHGTVADCCQPQSR